METVKFEHLAETPQQALSKAIKDGFILASESADTHFILEHILEEGHKWKAVLRILYEPGTAYRDGHTHLFIRQRDEHAYLPLKKTHKFDYVHVIDKGTFWNTILKHHPDLELYDATHADSEGKEGKTGSGGFVRPTLTQKPQQAFSGKIGFKPSI